jgi:hypothetical protein
MKIIKPTSEDQYHGACVSVFLAGSIEMGAAIDWQAEIPEYFKDKKVTFYNPRRDDWDSSWKQEQSNPQFNYQVNWEMSKLDESDIIFMYFSPETKSPISLLELGAYGEKGNMIVCCPDGFWRKGNVEIFCTRHNIPMFNTMTEAVGALRTKITARIYQYE